MCKGICSGNQGWSPKFEALCHISSSWLKVAQLPQQPLPSRSPWLIRPHQWHRWGYLFFFFSCLDCLGLHWSVWNEVISTNVINHKCWQQMQAKPSSVRWPALFEPRWGVQSTVLHTSLSRWWNRYDWIPIDMTNTIWDETRRPDMSILIEMWTSCHIW